MTTTIRIADTDLPAGYRYGAHISGATWWLVRTHDDAAIRVELRPDYEMDADEIREAIDEAMPGPWTYTVYDGNPNAGMARVLRTGRRHTEDEAEEAARDYVAGLDPLDGEDGFSVRLECFGEFARDLWLLTEAMA